MKFTRQETPLVLQRAPKTSRFPFPTVFGPLIWPTPNRATSPPCSERTLCCFTSKSWLPVLTLLRGYVAWRQGPSTPRTIGQGSAHRNSSARQIHSKHTSENQVLDPNLERFLISSHILICSNAVNDWHRRLLTWSDETVMQILLLLRGGDDGDAKGSDW